MPTDTKITISAQDKTKRAFKSVNAGMKGMGGNILNVRGKILSLIGVGGMGALIKSSVDAADAIGKTADKLGIATDALQEYRFAAELTGVGQTALDTGLQRFTRRLAEADKGTGELAKTLTELNISTRNNDGTVRSAESVLNDYADAIKGAESEQEQLRLAFKAFDTEGAAMVNTLRGGAEGLAALRQEARDAGVVMDEDLIRKAEIANDKWNTLAATIGTKFRSALISALDVFVDLRDAEQRLSDLNDEMERTAENIRKIADAGSVTGLGQFAIKELERETVALKLMREERDKLAKQVKRDKENEGSGSGSGSGGSKTDSGVQKAAERAQKEEAADRQRLAARFDRLNTSLLNEEDRLQLDFDNKQFLIETAFQEGIATEVQRSDALLSIKQEHEDKVDALQNEREAARLERTKEQSELWDQVWSNSINNFAGGIGDAVGGAIVEQDNLGEALRATMKGVAKQVISSLVEIGIKKAILAATSQGVEKAIVASSVVSGATVAGAWAPAASLVSLASFGANSAPASAGIASTFALTEGLALAGQAHDGLDNVPADGTFLLKKGEMVLDPGTSKAVRDNVTSNVDNSNVANSINVTVVTNDANSFDGSLNRGAETIWNIIMDRMNEEGLSFS